jgi:hypothetical protein
VVSSSPGLLILLVVLLPFAAPGNFTAFLKPDTLPIVGDAGPTQVDDLTSFPIVAFASPPSILSVAPSQAPSAGPGSAGIVNLWLSGFPPAMAGATVLFGGERSTLVAGPQPDGLGGLFLSVRVPAAAAAGLTNVTVTYHPPNASTEMLISAGRPFLFIADGTLARCSAGCKLYATVAAGVLQNVSLEVEFGPSQTTPDPSVLAVTCIARLNGRPVEVGPASDCKIESFTIVAAGCVAGTTGGVSCLRIEALVAVNPAAVMTTLTTAGFISITARGSDASSWSLRLAVTVEFRRPPRLSAATLSSSYGWLLLEFDGPTAAAELPCAALVRATADPAGGFGASPVCRWVDLTHLEITLGPGATLATGDVVETSAIASSASDNGAAGAIAGEASRWVLGVAVAGSDRPQLPRVWLSGPAEIPACDNADLWAGVSGAPGARFEWGCADDTALDAHLRNGTVGPVATVPGALLAPGRTYMVSVVARPRFGMPSAPAFHVLGRAATPRPRLAISRPPPPLTRSRNLLLQAAAALSACAVAPPASPAYLWSIAQSVDGAARSQPVLSGQGPVLAIPAGVLAVGVQYTVTLDAVFPVNAGLPLRATAELALESEPVTVRLVGGDRTVRAGSVVALDASESFDPDTCTFVADLAAGGYTCAPAAVDADTAASGNGPLGFEWTCTSAEGSPCQRAADGAVARLGTGPMALLDLAALMLPPMLPAEIRIVVAVRRRATGAGGLGIAARTGVTLLVAEEAVLDVGIALQYMTATRAVYTALLPATTTATVSWTIVSTAGAAAASATSDLPSFFFPAGTAGRTLVVLLDAAGLFATRDAATQYRITMRVTKSGSDSSGTAIAVLAPPRPPSGGSCAAGPSAGIALVTRFEVRCWDWASDSLPLAYSFSARPNGTRSSLSSVAIEAATAVLASQEATLSLWELAVSWSFPGPDPAIGLFVFAPGDYIMAAAVMDAAGARTAINAANGRVSVEAARGGSAAGPDVTTVNALTDQLMQVGAIGPAIALLDSVAEHINYAAAAAATSSLPTPGRRLLASSSVQYRAVLRRMLLRQLAGIAVVAPASVVAPAILRAAWRAAAAPAEVDAGGSEAGAAALKVALGRLDVGGLRASSAFADAAALAAAVLRAAVPSADAAAAAALLCSTAAAMLSAVEASAAGMVDGEEPLIIEPAGGGIILYAARGALAPSAGVSADWADSDWSSVMNADRRGPSSAAASPPKGLCVLRLDPLARAPLPPTSVSAGSAAFATPFAEIVGVRIVTAEYGNSVAAAERWSCPAGKSGCVHVTVGVEWRSGPPPPAAAYSCMRWIAESVAGSGTDIGKWSTAGCGMESAAWVQRSADTAAGIGAAAAVQCNCDTDGIITAAAAAAPLPPPEPAAPKRATRLRRTHNANAALATFATAAAIVASVTTLMLIQCQYFKDAEGQASYELSTLAYADTAEGRRCYNGMGSGKVGASLWSVTTDSCVTLQPSLKPLWGKSDNTLPLSDSLYSHSIRALASLSSRNCQGDASTAEFMAKDDNAGTWVSAELVFDLGCGVSTPVWPSRRQPPRCSDAAGLADVASMAAASAASAVLAAEAAAAAAVAAAAAALAAADNVSRRARLLDCLAGTGSSGGQRQQPTGATLVEWGTKEAEEEDIAVESAEVVSAGECDRGQTSGMEASGFEFLEIGGTCWLPAGANLRAVLPAQQLAGLLHLVEPMSESDSETQSSSEFKLDLTVGCSRLPVQWPPWNVLTAHDAIWPGLPGHRDAVSSHAAALVTGNDSGREASPEEAEVAMAAEGASTSSWAQVGRERFLWQ